MSDESTRSAHGNPPHHGPSDGIPAWWSELARTDLPDDPQRIEPGSRAKTATAFPQQPRRERPARSAPTRTIIASSRSRLQRHERLLNAAVLAAVLAAAVAVTWVGMGDPSPRGLLVVAFIFGVPMVLTVAVVGLVARRLRH